MKRKGKLSFMLCLAVIVLLAGCTKEPAKQEDTANKKTENEKTEGEKTEKEDDNTISEGARKIIETITTCPNEDLFNEDMVYAIGLGVELTEEEKEKVALANEKATKNWEDAIGEYFAPKGLESFRNSGESGRYFSLTRDTDVKVELKNMELVEKDNLAEKVRATVSVDGVDEQIVVTFRYDNSEAQKGLIYRIEITNEE